MKLTSTGHAGWRIETPTVRILCDPWFNPRGAFFSSWFPLPASDHLNPADFYAIDVLYVSHVHEDHFDRWFLSQLDKSVPVLIARFRNPDLRDSLVALGFANIVELDPDQTWRLREITVRILRDEDYGLYRDSSLVLSDGDATIVNQNDCRLSEADAEQFGAVDALLLHFSGANWYPAVYGYPPQRKAELTRDKRSRGFNRMLRYAQLTHARNVFPCAGPPAFLDPALFARNDLGDPGASIFPMADEAVRFLAENDMHGLLSAPGDVFEVRGEKLATLLHRVTEPDALYCDRAGYLEDYARRRRPDIHAALDTVQSAPECAERFGRAARTVAQQSRWFAARAVPTLWELRGPYGGDFLMDLSLPAAESWTPFRGQFHGYRFTLETRFAWGLLNRPYIDWEDFFLSLRFEAWRDPDRYDENLFVILKNMDPRRLEIMEQMRNSAAVHQTDSFLLDYEGKRYRVQRYCPHMGSDLEKMGSIRDGRLVCGRHGWAFRLTDGHCENVVGPSIRIDPL